MFGDQRYRPGKLLKNTCGRQNTIEPGVKRAGFAMLPEHAPRLQGKALPVRPGLGETGFFSSLLMTASSVGAGSPGGDGYIEEAEFPVISMTGREA